MIDITTSDVEKILGRKQFKELLDQDLNPLKESSVLITGSEGSIGRKLSKILLDSGIQVFCSDIIGDTEYIMLQIKKMYKKLNELNPDIVVHLAGAKNSC